MAKPKGPLHNNPWDTAPKLDRGDEDPTALYSAVGQALTIWERLEDLHAWMFSTLVGSRSNSAYVAYGYVDNSSTRLSMNKAAAKITLKGDPKLLTDLIKTLDRIESFRVRRNDIAHGMVVNFQSSITGDEGKVVVTHHGHFLVPPYYSSKKRSRNNKSTSDDMWRDGSHAYTSAQVLSYATYFDENRRILLALVEQISNYCREKWPQV